MKNIKSILNLSLVIALFWVVASCGTTEAVENEQVESDLRVTRTEAVADGSEKYVATLAIEGMSCEMMCGGKIASTLEKLEGVKKVDIEFTDMDEVSFANVEYDSKVITEKEMVAGVHEIADGIYQVKSVNITHYKIAGNTVKTEEKTKVSSFDPQIRYKLPNIFSALVKVF